MAKLTKVEGRQNLAEGRVVFLSDAEVAELLGQQAKNSARSPHDWVKDPTISTPAGRAALKEKTDDTDA